MIVILFLLIAPSLLTSAVKVDPYARRELHVLFQKADANNDRFLDKKELTRFVDTFTRRVPRVYKGVEVSTDTLEGAHILAEELFKRADKLRAGRLSYKGSLLTKSEATLFGELAEKVIINLVHEVNEKPSPYPGVNPFSNVV
uniref:EF-hand domain-containing protein n=1 Tax=Steinernema glaseri TaxID=37863 RepID=A0A1I7YAG0_9BILA